MGKKLNLTEQVAQNIKMIRLEKGLTQEAMANVIGTSLRYYQKLESGQNLQLNTIEKIAMALKVKTDLLLTHK